MAGTVILINLYRWIATNRKSGTKELPECRFSILLSFLDMNASYKLTVFRKHLLSALLLPFPQGNSKPHLLSVPILS